MCVCMYPLVRFGSCSIARYKFDFPVLLFELVRNKIPLATLRRFVFVDTLSILEAVRDGVGPCRKLQCLVRTYCNPEDLRAHRDWGRTVRGNMNLWTLEEQLVWPNIRVSPSIGPRRLHRLAARHELRGYSVRRASLMVAPPLCRHSRRGR